MLKGLGGPAYVRPPRARLGHAARLEPCGRGQSRPRQTRPQSSVPDKHALESTPGSRVSHLPRAHAVILHLFAHLVSSKVVNVQLVGSSHSTHRAHQVRASSRTRRLCRQCRCGPRGPAQWLRQPRLHPRTRVQVHRRPPRRRRPSPRLLACLRPRPPAALCTLCHRHLLPLHEALVIGWALTLRVCRPISPPYLYLRFTATGLRAP
ncbi:hypothetical protein B0H10DRAFT_1204183 [Mycena sp. CBHHK59/15]|nr:hypothetical protein B0H10DRAFT_1204183 [Mycena sp. CBHHK59/15]